MDYDLLIRDGRVLALDGQVAADVAVADGVVAAVGPALSGSAATELDAGGLHVLPGGIDAHVHCDEPGRTAWEGFATASAALAVGGLTAFVDMPINSTPATTDTEAFARKVAAARAHSRLDFALWGGLVPGNVEELTGLHEAGAIGFKAFISETGMEDFRPSDDVTLLHGMRRIAELDSILAVHAENYALVETGRARAMAEGRHDARSYLDSRPASAELEAIGRVIAFARETGCRLHIVHVSTAEGITLVTGAQAAGVDVSWETAPHYLCLTDADVIALGPIAKCAPVMRGAGNRDRLWEHVASGPDAIVASDHSPCAPAMKDTEDFFAAWGGITGCQSTLNVLLDGVGRGRLTLERACAAVAGNVAARLRLPQKGAIAVGRDADLAVVDLGVSWSLTAEELRYRHPFSALVGAPMRGAVRHVYSRGRAIVADGELVGDARGELLRPVAAGQGALAC